MKQHVVKNNFWNVLNWVQEVYLLLLVQADSLLNVTSYCDHVLERQPKCEVSESKKW